MTNKEIYKKTLVFSLRRLIFDILAFALLAALGAAGFVMMERANEKGLIGLAIGLGVGLIILVVALRYVSYTYKAGQIAMMTRGVTEGALPEDVLGEGKAEVKARFATVAAFFAATRVIRGIFNELGRGLNRLGQVVGGDTGSGVADAVSTAIQVVVAYLCDCCLGWVFFRKDQKPVKATCEGAVLFFRHGKTLAKNLGRVFGLGLLSLLVIGGVFFGILFLVFSRFPAAFQTLAGEFAEAAARTESNLPQMLSDPATLTLVCAGLGAVILWSILHSVFVRPFVLVGVLRNYIESGVNDIPAESSFAMLDSKSPKFRKLRAEAL